MINSKRGLSPLIAAVLLIVVVVGIGALVAGIVREQVTSDKETIDRTSIGIDCSTQIDAEIPKIEDRVLICLGANYINLTIENTGSARIDEFQIKVFGDAGFADNDTIIESGLEPGDLESNYIAGFDGAAVGNVQQVMIVPKLKVPGSTQRQYCSDAQLKLADIDPC